jgi:hypothetical protein
MFMIKTFVFKHVEAYDNVKEYDPRPDKEYRVKLDQQFYHFQIFAIHCKVCGDINKYLVKF